MLHRLIWNRGELTQQTHEKMEVKDDSSELLPDGKWRTRFR